jgi:hypothetical protein
MAGAALERLVYSGQTRYNALRVGGGTSNLCELLAATEGARGTLQPCVAKARGAELFDLVVNLIAPLRKHDIGPPLQWCARPIPGTQWQGALEQQDCRGTEKVRRAQLSLPFDQPDGVVPTSAQHAVTSTTSGEPVRIPLREPHPREGKQRRSADELSISPLDMRHRPTGCVSGYQSAAVSFTLKHLSIRAAKFSLAPTDTEPPRFNGAELNVTSPGRYPSDFVVWSSDRG